MSERYSKTPGLIIETHDSRPREISTIEDLVFSLEKIRNEQWVHIELWASQKKGVSAENQEKKQAVYRKLKENFDTFKQAMTAFGGGELTWKRLQEDPKFQNLIAELQELLNIKSLKKYLEEKMAEQGELGKENENGDENLFMPNEYIDPNDFTGEQIQNANSVIWKRLQSMMVEYDNTAGNGDEEMAKSLATLQKFLMDQKTISEIEKYHGRAGGLDLAWLKINQPEVWHALCFAAKKEPKIIRLILGEPTIFTQPHGLTQAEEEQYEKARQEEITQALPNVFNLAILKTAFKTESDSEREQMAARELLKEFYGDNVPSALNSGDMLVLRAEISAALEHIKDENERQVIAEGGKILVSRFNKLNKIVKFGRWPEFFAVLQKIQNSQAMVMQEFLTKMVFRTREAEKFAIDDIKSNLDKLEQTPGAVRRVLETIGRTLGYQEQPDEARKRIRELMIFLHRILRIQFTKSEEFDTFSDIKTEALFEYINILHRASNAGVEISNNSPDVLNDLSYLNICGKMNTAPRRSGRNFREQDISNIDFSNTLLHPPKDTERHQVYLEFMARCNPEGSKFTGVENLPEWIKFGLDETGTFHNETLQKNLEAESKKVYPHNERDIPIEKMEMDKDGIYKEESLIAAGGPGLDLRGANLSKIWLTEINLDRANLEGALISLGSMPVGPTPTWSMLAGKYQWIQYALDKNYIYKTELLVKAIRDRAVKELRGANLRNVDLSGCDLSNVDFTGADLAGIDLSDTILNGANLTEANLYHANFTSVDFANCKLDRACVEGACFKYAINLPAWITKGFDNNNGKIFKKRQLAYAIMRYISGESRKENTYYTSGADNIKFADLTQMKLSAYRFANGTKVEIVDMKTLSWKHSDLRGADLSELDGAFADIEGARFDKNTKMPTKNGNWIKYGLENGIYSYDNLIRALENGRVDENIAGANFSHQIDVVTAVLELHLKRRVGDIIDGAKFPTNFSSLPYAGGFDREGIFHMQK